MRNKKIRMRKMMLFGIAVFIAIMIVSMMNGNERKEELIIIKSELDITKKLDEQFAAFDVIKITKNESDKYGNSVVRKLDSLVGKHVSVSLPVGSPIPVSVLLGENEASGEFASKMTESRTYYRIAGGVVQLPTGVAVGDKIDIGVLYKENNANSINLYMSNVAIGAIEGADILVDVSQREHYELTLASREGEFILQLPGRKEGIKCSELDPEDLGKINCYTEDDLPQKVTVDEVIDKIRKGQSKVIDSNRKETSEPSVETDAPSTEETLPNETPNNSNEGNQNQENNGSEVIDENDNSESSENENNDMSVDEQVVEDNDAARESLIDSFNR